MKAKLLNPQMGRPEGAVIEIDTPGLTNSYVSDADGQFYVANDDIGPLDQPQPERQSEAFQSSPPPEKPLVAPYIVDPTVEAEARLFYDDYCESVGGVAFNGDPLPPASEFFEDPKKQLQANAYRHATERLYDRAAHEVEKVVEDLSNGGKLTPELQEVLDNTPELTKDDVEELGDAIRAAESDDSNNTLDESSEKEEVKES